MTARRERSVARPFVFDGASSIPTDRTPLRSNCLSTPTVRHRRTPGERFTSKADKVVMMAAPQTPNGYPDLITVLVLVGLPAGPIHRELSRHAIDSSPDGVMVNVFNDLVRLPRYNDTLETHGTPDAVVALRMAATEA